MLGTTSNIVCRTETHESMRVRMVCFTEYIIMSQSTNKRQNRERIEKNGCKKDNNGLLTY